MRDIVIIGAGVVGLSLAYELSRRGAEVTVLERGAIGREASWAGAGMLPPGSIEKARHPIDLLRGHSAALMQQWSAELHEATGIDNGYRRCGGLEVALGEHEVTPLREVAQVWQAEGTRLQECAPADLAHLEPALSSAVRLAYHMPDQAQVRNPRHTKALSAACVARSVQLRTGAMVSGFATKAGRVTGVHTPAGEVTGDMFVVATGAWSAGVLRELGVTVRVKPIRGQIVLLSLPAPPFHCVLIAGARSVFPPPESPPQADLRHAGGCRGACYLVPRPDGRILVGSTEEDAGFDARPTPAGVHGLLEFAFELVPGLRDAHYERAWAGLRPGSADGLPYLGRAPQYENLFIATGHFRDGLQLSAGTALVMTQLICGEPTSVPLEAFRVDRAEGQGADGAV